MEVTVKLFATLRNGRGRVIQYAKDHSISVEEIITELKIDKKDVAILLVNGRDGSMVQMLEDGDVVSIFPPVGGG